MSDVRRHYVTSHNFVDSRLLGVWRSDRERTLAHWHFAAEASSAERKRMSNWFGKFTVRYTPARVFTTYEGDRTVCPYRVVAQDADSVAIMCRTDGRDEIRHIRFVESEVYVVPCGRGFEYFGRVPLATLSQHGAS